MTLKAFPKPSAIILLKWRQKSRAVFQKEWRIHYSRSLYKLVCSRDGITCEKSRK